MNQSPAAAKKRVLIISYHFPPDSEVGGLRAQKYAKYLPLYGWHPIVLSVNPKYYPVLDKARSGDVSCPVSRTSVWPGIRSTYLFAKNLFVTMRERLSGRREPVRRDSVRHLRDRNLTGLKGFLLNFAWLPDDRTGWILPALIRAVVLARKYRVDSIMTTSPPHSVQLTGYLLKKVLRKRWIIDFRDQWAMEVTDLPGFFAAANRKLERFAVQNADVVITATENVRSYFLKAYPALPAGKFICIPNGYDLEDFKKKRVEKTDRFTVSHIGDFYAGRSPQVFLQAISELIGEGLIDRKSIRLRFIGNVTHIGGQPLQEIVAEAKLADIAEIRGFVPYTEAIENILSSDLLLVISPQNFMHPMKVFEYMASGSSILAFTPPGALSDLVSRYPKGYVVGLNDIENTRKCILSCYRDHRSGWKKADAPPLSEYILSFERKNLTRRLAECL